MARGERVYHVTAPLLPKGPISKRRCRSVCTGCLFSANPVALRSAAAANRSAVHCVEVWAIRHGRLDRVSGRRGWERRSRSQGREGGEEKKKAEPARNYYKVFIFLLLAFGFAFIRSAFFEFRARGQHAAWSILFPPRQTDGMANAFFLACLFRRGPGNPSVIFLSIDPNPFLPQVRPGLFASSFILSCFVPIAPCQQSGFVARYSRSADLFTVPGFLFVF